MITAGSDRLEASPRAAKQSISCDRLYVGLLRFAGNDEQPASLGHALAATVDAAIPHAIGTIPAQSICLGLPWSGNVGSEKVHREESRCRRDLRDGARINGLVMESQMPADRRGAAGVRNGIRRGQSQSRECKGASQSGLCTHTS